MNQSPFAILKSMLLASLGLFLFAFGMYLTIQANIGAGPWEALNLGLSKTLGIQYGTASISVSLTVLMIDFLLREKIGIGMILDTFIVGKSVDLFNWLNFVPPLTHWYFSVPVMLLGLVFAGFAQFIYMRAGLGCGPRDSLLVGLARRMEKIPIGAISIMMLAAVTLTAWLLGGPVGAGTLIFAFCAGPVMQLCFRVVKFRPTRIMHQDLRDSFLVMKQYRKAVKTEEE